MLQVLVDADNVDPVRTRALLDALAGVETDTVVAGHPRALARVDWPEDATVVEAAGWQRADLVLAAAYRPSEEPLVLVSGDGDFGLLVGRHGGPVLIVSEAASYRLAGGGVTVVDPAIDGLEPLRQWVLGVS
ncbi:MAG: hypothetical protein QOE45_704 [Frankiaceae bacterium]|nr:hypothetical protein [Frankiaceae bacterium]